MWKDLIVAIFAATDARDPTTGVFGTGYPVTEDLILTSRHVVVPENQNIPGRQNLTYACFCGDCCGAGPQDAGDRP